jgi:predicted TIM-barrel fold metal-dependent hydrolase
VESLSVPIDVDQHIFESRHTWGDYIDPLHRADALSIDDDELGWPWLVWRGERLAEIESQVPGQPELIGVERARRAAGLEPETPYDERVPASYRDAPARVAALDEWGLDGAVVFPNFGLLWERTLGVDVPALCANLRAANRWQAANAADGGGRLFPVAHVTMRDPDWLVEEVARLARDGLRLAMLGPAPVDGRRLSHPDHDRMWAAFCEHGITPVFHVGGFEPSLHPAWFGDDPNTVDSVIGGVFLYVPPAAAIADLAINGVFERFPELRIGIVELSAGWLPMFLLNLDGAFDFHARRHGAPFVDLPLRPSDYILRQVRIAALPYEDPGRLIRHLGDEMVLFGSDWPHAEGVAHPRDDYERHTRTVEGRARDQLYDGNARWLLRMD